MSTDNVTVATNVIQTVTNTSTNTVAYSTTVNEPIISAGSQGIQGIQGISSANELALLVDVSLSNLADGSLLVYDSYNQVWTATNTLEKQALNCGQY